MSDLNSKKVVDVRVYCQGIKKRCRLQDRHSFVVAEGLDPATFNQAEVETKAIQIVQANMKTIRPMSQVLMSMQDITEKREDGFISRSFMLFTDRKVDLTPRIKVMG